MKKSSRCTRIVLVNIFVGNRTPFQIGIQQIDLKILVSSYLTLFVRVFASFNFIRSLSVNVLCLALAGQIGSTIRE